MSGTIIAGSEPRKQLGRTDAGPLAVVNLIQGRSATGTSQQQR